MPIKDRINKKQRRNLYKVLEMMPDKWVIHLQYYAALGRRLNLNNPQRFTEKIEWYKLNYRNPLMTICADKYLVRSYVEDKGYSELLPELYGVFDSYDEINFSILPKSFAIKSNNGSGTNIFIKDKEKMDVTEVEKIVRSWDKVNTLSIGREWVYKDIEQKIVIEELLNPEDDFQISNGLNDYKIMCFNGVAKYIWVDINRSNDHQRNFYDLEWNLLDVTSDKPQYSGEIEKPDGLKKMLEIATTFSEDFPFVRVDFYSLNGNVYIGELTFYPWSGTVQFTPDCFDFHLGELFKLPSKVEKGNKNNEK
ncbi:ATP-grasp fold amidoligase family protein [Aerococcus viridans]